ncbi:MAG: ABC transporter permease [Solirubrobacteraceae bacterium]
MSIADISVAPGLEVPAPQAGPRARRSVAVARRLAAGLAVLIPIVAISSFIIYSLGAISGNNPAATILGQTGNATPAAIAKLDRVLGLNQPLVIQWLHWLSRAVQGDFGRSYFTQIPVAQSIAQRFPVDLSIVGLATLIAIVVGGSAGILAATRRGGVIDQTVTFVCSVLSTLPAFVVGIALVVIFAMGARLLPGNGYVSPGASVPLWLQHIILPSLALSAQVAVDIARQLRTSLVAVLDENYVVGATVRGLPRRRVLSRHALRNALGPAVTVLGYDVPLLITGAVAAEAVFSLPGLGQLVLQSAQTRDVPVVQGVLLVTSTLVIVSNLVVNEVLRWLRPGDDR